MANTGSNTGNTGGISPEVAALGAASINALGNLAVDAAKNKKQWKYQQRAMDKQQAMNIEAWNMQNAYNTPQAQMERLAAAGLNPNLIYGSGSSAPNMASPQQVAEAPVRQAAGTRMPDLLEYYQVRQMDAQYNQTVMSTDLMAKNAALKDLESGLKSLDLMKEQMRSGKYPSLIDSEVNMKKWVALRSKELFTNEERKGINLLRQGNMMDQLSGMRQEQTTGIQLDNAFKQHRNELAKLGIYASDHPAFRVLIQASKRMNIDLGELLAEGSQKLKYLLDLKK